MIIEKIMTIILFVALNEARSISIILMIITDKLIVPVTLLEFMGSIFIGGCLPNGMLNVHEHALCFGNC